MGAAAPNPCFYGRSRPPDGVVQFLIGELLDMADFLTVQRSKTGSFMVFDQGDERPFFACSPGMIVKDLICENSFMTIQAESSS